ncbi:hypothetical protein M8J76_007060 [Diaphorina citri]|nr:hypothetical protein M8J75_011303 [Diaphorina citri]KAI5719229.1 hypothetical protein M8J76_007060 [Diaphorina citri]KAI5720400.1 hypothetical protein M8J77_005995 [Diaphorina citri]
MNFYKDVVTPRRYSKYRGATLGYAKSDPQRRTSPYQPSLSPSASAFRKSNVYTAEEHRQKLNMSRSPLSVYNTRCSYMGRRPRYGTVAVPPVNSDASLSSAVDNFSAKDSMDLIGYKQPDAVQDKASYQSSNATAISHRSAAAVSRKASGSDRFPNKTYQGGCYPENTETQQYRYSGTFDRKVNWKQGNCLEDIPDDGDNSGEHSTDALNSCENEPSISEYSENSGNNDQGDTRESGNSRGDCQYTTEDTMDTDQNDHVGTFEETNNDYQQDNNEYQPSCDRIVDEENNQGYEGWNASMNSMEEQDCGTTEDEGLPRHGRRGGTERITSRRARQNQDDNAEPVETQPARRRSRRRNEDRELDEASKMDMNVVNEEECNDTESPSVKIRARIKVRDAKDTNQPCWENNQSKSWESNQSKSWENNQSKSWENNQSKGWENQPNETVESNESGWQVEENLPDCEENIEPNQVRAKRKGRRTKSKVSDVANLSEPDSDDAPEAPEPKHSKNKRKTRCKTHLCPSSREHKRDGCKHKACGRKRRPKAHNSTVFYPEESFDSTRGGLHQDTSEVEEEIDEVEEEIINETKPQSLNRRHSAKPRRDPSTKVMKAAAPCMGKVKIKIVHPKCCKSCSNRSNKLKRSVYNYQISQMAINQNRFITPREKIMTKYLLSSSESLPEVLKMKSRKTDFFLNKFEREWRQELQILKRARISSRTKYKLMNYQDYY